VFANFAARKARVALTVAAVALSVSLVVSVTTGYHSMEAAIHQFMDQYMGTIDAQIARVNDQRGRVSEEVVRALRADPDVARANGRLEIDLKIDARGNDEAELRTPQVFGVERPGDRRLDALNFHAGGWFTDPNADEAVIDQALAEAIKARVGDTLTLKGARPSKLKISGIVHKPELIATQVWTVYVPLRTLQRHLGEGWDQPPYFVSRSSGRTRSRADWRRLIRLHASV
jgi:ABC-type lipoprotein release transport system permease subunit